WGHPMPVDVSVGSPPSPHLLGGGVSDMGGGGQVPYLKDGSLPSAPCAHIPPPPHPVQIPGGSEPVQDQGRGWTSAGGGHRHPPGQRGRRHTGVRLHHAQPLRVGCVLGTCQVQNLSHRLWQLMGRPGRQDSSPMNPNSPHSYG
uniref:Adrenomedullin 2 n=1 Tax=Pavo cristatus TaxID=9049 RepID=A0A8C9LAL8_PAVCR